MKFSIITSTFNRRKKLTKTINSVLKQKYHDWEYYIIDDNSNDDTLEFLKKIKDERIKIISLNDNFGQPGAIFNSNVLNKIIGDLIIFLDSDDLLFDNALNRILIDFNQSNNSCDYLAYKFTDDIKKINTRSKTEINFFNSKDIFQDIFPLNINKNGFVDHLFVYTFGYIKNFKKFFIEPKYWYVARYETHIKYNFNVGYSNFSIYYMSIDNDSVTRGNNFHKYAPITLFTRRYIFENFQPFMNKTYLTYSFYSYVLNLLIFPNNKIKILKLLLKYKKISLNKPFFLILLIVSILIPAKFLYLFKVYLKKIRTNR